MTTTVGIVGVGAVARHHLTALATVDGVEVVGGVDPGAVGPMRFRGEPRPVYRTVAELLATGPGAVIVASPTSTHHEVCRTLLDSPRVPARILVEKPAADRADRAATVIDAAPVEVLYHAAYGPEVCWAVERLPHWLAGYGDIVAYESFFGDPYRGHDAERLRRVYGDSWLDSGINALSVAARLVTLQGLVRSDPVPTGDPTVTGRSAEIRFRSGRRAGVARTATSWDVAVATKRTTVRFARGAVLELDHQRVQGRFRPDPAGSPAPDPSTRHPAPQPPAPQRAAAYESYRYDGDSPRLTAHYACLFDALFNHPVDPGHRATSRRLHEILFDAAVRTPPP